MNRNEKGRRSAKVHKCIYGLAGFAVLLLFHETIARAELPRCSGRVLRPGQSCSAPLICDLPQAHCASNPGNVGGSVDPNDKSGPRGSGQAQYLGGADSLSYEIHFENLATAALAAQQVVITDQLDPQAVDLNTFSLGPISFGSHALIPPAALSQFSRNVDVRPAQNLLVRIDASLNKTTGLITWRFTSIDPATLQLTTDPTIGFLPPNTNPPAGEGTVVFTISQKPGLSTGTQIPNQATVVFDVNAPIATPVWSNAIDNTPPVTHVLTLPAAEASASFPVQWTGSDTGSGVSVFSIYVSDNGGPFTVWQDQTTGTSGTFTGQAGHTYGFYSLGRDLVGNQEPVKISAEAITQVGMASSCAQDVTSQIAIVRSGFGYNFTTGQFIQTVTLTNSGVGMIGGPISLVLDNLSSNITLAGASNVTMCAAPLGSPFINIAGPLNPGASAVVNLQFNDPSKTGITYTARVLSGGGNR